MAPAYKKRIPAGPGGHKCAVALQALDHAIKYRSKSDALEALQKAVKCPKSRRPPALRRSMAEAKKLLMKGF